MTLYTPGAVIREVSWKEGPWGVGSSGFAQVGEGSLNTPNNTARTLAIPLPIRRATVLLSTLTNLERLRSSSGGFQTFAVRPGREIPPATVGQRLTLAHFDRFSGVKCEGQSQRVSSFKSRRWQVTVFPGPRLEGVSIDHWGEVLGAFAQGRRRCCLSLDLAVRLMRSRWSRASRLSWHALQSSTEGIRGFRWKCPEAGAQQRSKSTLV